MNKPSAKRENEKGQIQMGKREEKRTKCPTLGGDIEIDNDIEARRRLAFIHCVVAGKDIYKEQRDTYIYIYIFLFTIRFTIDKVRSRTAMAGTGTEDPEPTLNYWQAFARPVFHFAFHFIARRMRMRRQCVVMNY